MTKRSNSYEEILPLGIPKGAKPEQVLKKIHSFEGKTAEFISNWAGSVTFVYIHVIWFTLWILINMTGVFADFVPAFDPFPFGLLTMIVSLEAIFLATFIMINQNRQVLVDTYRELEEEIEEQEEEKEHEELEEDVQDIQQDLDEIKNAVTLISKKIENIEKSPQTPKQNPNT